MRVFVTPGTPEWHQWRKTGLGASLAPVICGNSPYQTARELAEELTGKREPKPENPAMRLGSALEADVFNRFSGTVFAQCERNWCMASDELPYVLASLDGYDPSNNMPCEIKMVGVHALAEIRRTGLPLEHHLDQLHQQMYVTKSDAIYYCAYTCDRDTQSISDIYLLGYAPPPGKIEETISQVTAFWAAMKIGELPEPSDRDWVDIIPTASLKSTLNRYAQVRADIAELTEQQKKLEAELWAKLGDVQKAKVGQAYFSVQHRQGAINYKAIEQLKGLNLDNYRSKPITYRQIRIKDDTNDGD